MKQKSLSIFLALSSLFQLQTFATPMELSRILPKKTTQADVMTVGADPATAEKMIRLMAEFKKIQNYSPNSWRKANGARPCHTIHA